MNIFPTNTHKVTNVRSIMHFYCDDYALLLQKFVLEDFYENRMQTEYINYLQLLKQRHK